MSVTASKRGSWFSSCSCVILKAQARTPRSFQGLASCVSLRTPEPAVSAGVPAWRRPPPLLTEVWPSAPHGQSSLCQSLPKLWLTRRAEPSHCAARRVRLLIEARTPGA